VSAEQESTDFRAIASRSMVSEDARWMADALVSAQHSGGAWPIALFGHACRVVFEGTKLAQDDQLGLPALADLLRADYSREVGRARQATKILDDKHFPLDALRLEMAATYAEHHARFTGNSVWFARHLETDLSVVTLNGRVIAASIPLARRFGLEVLDENSVFGMSRSLGAALRVLSSIGGDGSPPEPSVDYNQIGEPQWHDLLSRTYLEKSYDAVTSFETKLILLMVESEIATSAEVLPHMADRFKPSVFRSQVVVLYHVLSSLRKISETAIGGSSAAEEISQLLNSDEARYFLESEEFRMVRNYSMHYGIRDPRLSLDDKAPMFGLIEILTNSNFEQLARDVMEFTVILADSIQRWRARA
jgi:hypothetical protein